MLFVIVTIVNAKMAGKRQSGRFFHDLQAKEALSGPFQLHQRVSEEAIEGRFVRENAPEPATYPSTLSSELGQDGGNCPWNYRTPPCHQAYSKALAMGHKPGSFRLTKGLEAGFKAPWAGIVGLHQGEWRASGEGGGDGQTRPGGQENPGPDPFGSQLCQQTASLFREFSRRGR